jgi:hypothetical protein
MILRKNRTLATFIVGISLLLTGCDDYYRIEVKDPTKQLKYVVYNAGISTPSVLFTENSKVISGTCLRLEIDKTDQVNYFTVEYSEYQKYRGIWTTDPKISVEKE